MNKDWHKQHRMPRDASPRERVQWHLEHREELFMQAVPQGTAVETERTGKAAVCGQGRPICPLDLIDLVTQLNVGTSDGVVFVANK